MIRSSRSDPIPVSRAGCLALGTLGKAASGRVVAVFDRSFYVDLQGRYVCFGCEDIGNGPLNALLLSPPAAAWGTGGLKVGDLVAIDDTTIHLAHCCRIDFANAQVWLPRLPATVPDAAALSINLGRLRLAVGPQAPQGGLAGLAFADLARVPGDPLMAYATRPYGALRGWLSARLEHGRRDGPACPPEIGDLIGAGPGLTPSGDDVLAGALVTLHRLGETQALACLAERICAELADRTNAISAAHLRAAMQGFAAEPMVAAIDDLAFGRTVAAETIMRELCSLGATSGLDGLAGIVAVLECWLTVRTNGVSTRRDGYGKSHAADRTDAVFPVPLSP